ncbi:ATP-binding protein [Catenovulum agarivorans]|uniref:ATP-binding protein n=1 Tax=Catenovulum agarivorans TaxID=1172192 RepID=UPI0002DA8CBA|nr:ATP-binding protein [Catenovulum agarivorans]
MDQNNQPTLQQHITRKTLPKVLTMLLIVGFLLFVYIQRLVEHEITDQQQEIAEQFSHALNKTEAALLSQVESLANNDLVINSLIDIDGRKQYINLLFNSFVFAGIKSSQISLLDFEGQVVTSNQIKHPVIDKKLWFTAVLQQGKVYRQLSEKGWLFIAPIKYGASPEGAIYAFIPRAQVQPLLTLNLLKTDIIYLDKHNNIVFQTTPELATDSFQFATEQLQAFKFYLETLNDGSKIYVLQAAEYAYQQVIIFIIVLIVVLIGLILVTTYSISLAANFASQTLHQFVKAIENQDEYASKDINHSENIELYEMAQLRHQFDGLLDELFATNVSKEQFQSVINSISESLAVFDLNGRCLLHNNAFDHFKSQVLTEGVASINLIEECHRAAVFNLDNELYEFESMYNLKDGDSAYQQVFIHWHRTLYLTSDGRLAGIVLVGIDVTLQKNIDRELLIRDRAIETAPCGILIVDASLDSQPIVYVNPAFEAITGYDKAEVLGQNCRFLQGEESDPQAVEQISQAIRLQQPITTTIINYTKQGKKFYNQLSITPVFDNHGKLTHYLGIQNDVTERMAAENQLKTAIVEREQALEKAQESAKLKSAFLASMSHEIRTPMNGVLGMLNILQNTDMSSRQHHYTKLAQHSANSLLVLINDILDFSKIEAGKIDIEKVPTNIQELIENVGQTYAIKAFEKGLQLLVDATDLQHIHLLTDPTRYRQILTNLVGNAIKFTEHGSVSIKANSQLIENKSVRLTLDIIDTGIGIDQNKFNSLFSAFTQVDASTTRKFGGTGLGLAISKQLANLLDGDIQVKSQHNHGSTFTVEIHCEFVEVHNQRTLHHACKYKVLLIGEESQYKKLLNKQLLKIIEHPQNLTNTAQLNSVEEPKDSIVCFTDLLTGATTTEQLLKQIEQLNQDTICLIIHPVNYPNEALRELIASNIKLLSYPITSQELIGVLNNLTETEWKKTTNKAVPEHPITDKFKRILLVEDNEINQLVAQTMLEPYAELIDVANHGLEAIDMLFASQKFGQEYDLILMDCQMPQLDGYQTTLKIRQGDCGDSYKNIPIIAMTANAMVGDKEKCLEAGMDDYIVKPINKQIIAEVFAHWQSITQS